MRRLVSVLLFSLSLPVLSMAAGPAMGPAPEQVVRRGERVSLIARVGAVVATVDALALRDGAAGEVIRVRNLQNGKELSARVIGAGQVEVTQ